MVKVRSLHLKDSNMKENGRMGVFMDKEHFSGQTGTSMKENGKLEKFME